MCGIAGIVDLAGNRDIGNGIIRKMTQAIIHRGPDEEGYFQRGGLALGSRRLSIVGLADGQQPVANEDRSVSAVFNGEFFDYPEKRLELTARGHRIITHCDTEIIPHLWEESQEGMFERLRGQFALALWDERRNRLVLGRDRFGICPLYWTRQGDWILFASEIKALLASGMVPPQPDLRGIDHIFTFSGLPGPTTCFEGVQLLPPGRYLQITPAGGRGAAPAIVERTYWQMDFPDCGDENPGGDPAALVDRFENLMLQAVERRLRADVPVGAYLSGGLDSSVIVALACHLKGSALNTYTIRVNAPELDELGAANFVARHIGTKAPIVQEFAARETLNTYPHLVQAAEAPVLETSGAALLLLARLVHACGQKVVLTGEGADEWLVGYPWYKTAKLVQLLDLLPGLPLSDFARRGYLRLRHVPQYPPEHRRAVEKSIGGPNAWIDAYGMLEFAKLRFYAAPMREVLQNSSPWTDLQIPLERAKRWHPLNRGIWVAARVTLAGRLLQAKGDRVSMHSSVEIRYPFLDEEVFDFLAGLHTRWKLRGFRDKHLLRLLAERWLPPSVYRRRKIIFRAPRDYFHIEPVPKYVAQLLSEESLRRTGYFDIAAVQYWRRAFRQMQVGSLARFSVEMGLTAVLGTQLWHHLFVGGDLSDLPTSIAEFRPSCQFPATTPSGQHT